MAESNVHSNANLDSGKIKFSTFLLNKQGKVELAMAQLSGGGGGIISVHHEAAQGMAHQDDMMVGKTGGIVGLYPSGNNCNQFLERWSDYNKGSDIVVVTIDLGSSGALDPKLYWCCIDVDNLSLQDEATRALAVALWCGNAKDIFDLVPDQLPAGVVTPSRSLHGSHLGCDVWTMYGTLLTSIGKLHVGPTTTLTNEVASEKLSQIPRGGGVAAGASVDSGGGGKRKQSSSTFDDDGVEESKGVVGDGKNGQEEAATPDVTVFTTVQATKNLPPVMDYKMDGRSAVETDSSHPNETSFVVIKPYIDEGIVKRIVDEQRSLEQVSSAPFLDTLFTCATSM